MNYNGQSIKTKFEVHGSDEALLSQRRRLVDIRKEITDAERMRMRMRVEVGAM